MKLNLWKSALALFLAFGIQACGEDVPTPTPPKTPEQLATETLTGTGTQVWGVAGGGKVTKGGTDVTDLYASFELALTSVPEEEYSSKNSSELFDSNGRWTFAGTNFDKIILTGSKPAADREISFTQSGTNLKLMFSIPMPDARVNAVAGDYVFDLIKK